MKTLSEKEFKAKYGTAGVEQVNAVSQSKPQDKGYLSRVGGDIKGNVQEALQSQKASMNGNMNPFAAGANIAKNVTGAVLAPLNEAPGIKQIGEGFSKAGQAIVDTPIGNKITNKLASTFSPQTLGAASDIVETGLNVGAIAGGVESVSKGIKGAKAIVEKSKSTPRPTVKNTTDQHLSAAIKDATPDYESLSQTQKAKYLDRVNEGGIIEGRSIIPDELNTRAGTELSKVPGYDPNGTKLSKYQAAKAEIKRQGESFKESLKNEKQVIPKRETAKVAIEAINKVPEKSLLLQASDPVLKNYTRVLKNALVKEHGSLLGVQKLIETLDDAYENARGKNKAFNSDTLNVLDEVHKASRDALTKYLIEKAKSTDVKLAKQRLWDLYRATDELRIAASKESGSSLGRLQQKNPVTSKIIKKTAEMTGLGGIIRAVD